MTTTPETDEERERREDREEVARLHKAGDHEHCDQTCEIQLPSDMLRNFIVAKGYPGTGGALDELLRRAAAGVVAQPEPLSPTFTATPAPKGTQSQPEPEACRSATDRMGPCIHDLANTRPTKPDTGRRERWEVAYRQYDAHDYTNLATIGMGKADEEQQKLLADRTEMSRLYLAKAEEAVRLRAELNEVTGVSGTLRRQEVNRLAAENDRLRAELEQAQAETHQFRTALQGVARRDALDQAAEELSLGRNSPDPDGCTCAIAGEEFRPARHYRDCPLSPVADPQPAPEEPTR
ncbi:hypothetical protein HY68_36520 [Streptomyces sp. AcH 505]|uniref:hypothetical protein n=1 Tax=Streptomyces sp. AcH 505 TaxID=352211 RepID=UPI0005921BE5|nr:hypothetical protein HY68_36520 [Streptomyces sp. AcH 505]